MVFEDVHVFAFGITFAGRGQILLVFCVMEGLIGKRNADLQNCNMTWKLKCQKTFGMLPGFIRK